MLSEGLYGLSFRSMDRDEPASADGLALLRHGKILGSDRYGGLFFGSYEPAAGRPVGRVRVRLEMPPGGTLVTGLSVGPEGAALDIECMLEGSPEAASAVIDVGGKPLAVAVRFLGALPG
jgi:hypothetical protein